MQETSYNQKVLKEAKRQGIISCRLMLATVAVSFFTKLYLIFTRPHGESQEQLIKMLEGSVNFVLFLAAAVYMWYALKKLEEIYDTDVLSTYKQMIFCIYRIYSSRYSVWLYTRRRRPTRRDRCRIGGTVYTSYHRLSSRPLG